MFPTPQEITQAITVGWDRCERDGDPPAALADYVKMLRVSRGWHEAAVWLVERRLGLMLRDGALVR